MLALKRYRFDWLHGLCSILSMAAFLTPMLTVMGIREGLVGTLRERLLANPRNLELTPIGTRDYSEEFFKDLKNHRDVGFVIPETRALSATMELIITDGAAAGASFQADLAATDVGDPLLDQAQAHIRTEENSESAEEILKSQNKRLELNEIFITEALAGKLNLEKGETVMGRVGRRSGGEDQSAAVELTVLGILPQHITPGYHVFCSLKLLNATEDYRNGWEVADLSWPGEPKGDFPERYARFRLYAKTLDGVEILRKHLEGLGVETRTQATQIALVKTLDDAFQVVFVALFTVAGLGAFASVVSGSIDQVTKTRRSLAVMTLLGLSRFKLLSFTMIQSALNGILASAAGAGLFTALAWTLNFYFKDGLGNGERMCRLPPETLLMAAAVTVFLMTFGSGFAYVKLASIEPSEGMRDV
jgi:putative ABC transport system permease protein